MIWLFSTHLSAVSGGYCVVIEKLQAMRYSCFLLMFSDSERFIISLEVRRLGQIRYKCLLLILRTSQQLLPDYSEIRECSFMRFGSEMVVIIGFQKYFITYSIFLNVTQTTHENMLHTILESSQKVYYLYFTREHSSCNLSEHTKSSVFNKKGIQKEVDNAVSQEY